MRNYFTFGSIDSRNYGIYLSGNKKFLIPTRSYQFEAVPGKLGDVVTSGRRVSNIQIVYPCGIAPVTGSCGNYSDFKTAWNALKNDLLSVNGYANLSDSYDVTHYYEAAFAGNIEANMTQMLEAGEFDLTFICKPQRFLTTQTTSTITAGSQTTVTTSGGRGYPVFTLAGTGTLDVIVDGNTQETVTVTQNFTNGIVIDCKRKVCYDVDDSTASGNLFVNFSNYQYPEINKFGSTVGTTVTFDSTGLSGTVEVGWYEL